MWIFRNIVHYQSTDFTYELKFAKRAWDIVLHLSSLELCFRCAPMNLEEPSVIFSSSGGTFLWWTWPGSWNWCRFLRPWKWSPEKKGDKKGRWSEGSLGGGKFQNELDVFFWRCVYCYVSIYIYVIQYFEQVFFLTATTYCCSTKKHSKESLEIPVTNQDWNGFQRSCCR